MTPRQQHEARVIAREEEEGMTEYSGAKAPTDPYKNAAEDEAVLANQEMHCCGEEGVDEDACGADGDCIDNWIRKGFRAGQRAQAEADARIAETQGCGDCEYAECKLCREGTHIADAIRAAAPKEGE